MKLQFVGDFVYGLLIYFKNAVLIFKLAISKCNSFTVSSNINLVIISI